MIKASYIKTDTYSEYLSIHSFLLVNYGSIFRLNRDFLPEKQPKVGLSFHGLSVPIFHQLLETEIKILTTHLEFF